MVFGTGFSSNKLKPQLKMAVNRFQIASNKKSVLMQQNMRQVALLLAEDPPKEEKARIRAEALIRDDNLIEAYEILQLECELLAERIKLIEYSKICPPDLESCISTLIYAAPRVDIPELSQIRRQFQAKYGKKFVDGAKGNINGILNERVVHKLSVHPPAAYLVHTYLESICEQYEVDWKPTITLTAEQMIEPTAAPVGYSVQVAQGTGLGPVVTGQQDIDEGIDWKNRIAQDSVPNSPTSVASPSTNPPPSNPSIQQSQMGNGYQDNDFDEPDIIVPPRPSAPPSDGLQSESARNKRDDNNHGGGTDSQDSSASINDPSYESLTARFASLGK